MEELVSSEEETFGSESSKQAIDCHHPLRHPVVVAVLRLELKLAKHPQRQCSYASPSETAIGPDPPQARMRISDEAQAELAVGGGRFRGAKDGSNQIIVE